MRRIEYLSLTKITPAIRNPKAHRLDQIGASMQRFGYTEPVILDERTGRLVAGHGRCEELQALKDAGEPAPDGIEVEGDEWKVPVTRGWSSKDDKEAEAYIIASNKLVEAGGWDDDMLAKMFADGFNIAGTGMTSEEIDAIVKHANEKEPPKDLDEVPPTPVTPVSKLGDVWILGAHRIFCGSSTDTTTVLALLDGVRADMSWTDPPWNVAYGKTRNPAGWAKRDRQIQNDNLGDKFGAFVDEFNSTIFQACKPGAPLYMAMSAQEWPTIDRSLRETGFHWSSTIIWAKDSLVLSRKDYHTQYEPVWYGWRDDAPRLMTVKDRTQSDLWTIPRPKKSEEHPTMKPVELVARAIRNSCPVGGLVFEPFSGSGTTIVACEETKRACFAIELDPKYVDVAVLRWQQLTGKLAKLVGGETYEEAKVSRGG